MMTRTAFRPGMRNASRVGARRNLWTPAQPTTEGSVLPEHWYRADQGTWQDAGVTPAVGDGDVVGRWEDIASFADHVNQATADLKPTLQTDAGSALGGRPVIRFDGSNDYLRGTWTNGGTMTQPVTEFAVAKLDGSVLNDGNGYIITDGITDATRLSLYKSATPTPDGFAVMAGVILYGDSADADWHIWMLMANKAASQFVFDGDNIFYGNVGTQEPTGVTIGGRYNNASAWWKGDIAEVIVYDANLSENDRDQVGAYLAARYGLVYTSVTFGSSTYSSTIGT